MALRRYRSSPAAQSILFGLVPRTKSSSPSYAATISRRGVSMERMSSGLRKAPTFLTLLLISAALVPLATARILPANAASPEDATPTAPPPDSTPAPPTPSGAAAATPGLKGTWVPQVLPMSRCSPPAVQEGMGIVCESDLVPACCAHPPGEGIAAVCVTGVKYGEAACPAGYMDSKACCK